MHGRRRDAQPLCPFGHCGIVDRLDVNPEFIHEAVGNELAFHGVPDHHGDNVAWIFDVRDPCFGKACADICHPRLMLLPLGMACLQMLDRCRRTSRNSGR